MLREQLTFREVKSRLYVRHERSKHREIRQQREKGRKPGASRKAGSIPFCRKKWTSPSTRDWNQSGQDRIIIWAGDWWQHQAKGKAVKSKRWWERQEWFGVRSCNRQKHKRIDKLRKSSGNSGIQQTCWLANDFIHRASLLITQRRKSATHLLSEK